MTKAPTSFVLYVLFGLALLATVSADFDFDFDFEGNISVTDDEAFRFRKTSVFFYQNLNELHPVMFWKSVAFGADIDSAHVDAIYGGVYAVNFPLAMSHPTSFLTYFNWAGFVSEPEEEDEWLNFNTSLSAGFIGSTFLFLNEVTPSGIIATSNRLGFPEVVWVSQLGFANDSMGLYYLTLKGTPKNLSWNMYITFIVSSRLGKLSVADAIVSPKALETIVQISNYTYVAPENHLVLQIAVGSGRATTSTSGSLVYYRVQTGNSSLYLTFTRSVIVDGKQSDLTISIKKADEDILENQFLKEQLEETFDDDEIEYSLVSIIFPAGAKSILYDPSMGAGEPVEALKSYPLWWIFVLIGVLVVVLIAIVLALVLSRRTNYQQF